MGRLFVAQHRLTQLCGWLVAIVLLFDSHVFSQEQSGQQFHGARIWTTKSSAAIKASVEQVNKNSVVFKLDSGDKKTIPLDNLILNDESLLRVLFLGQQDEQQLSSARSHVGHVVSNSGNAMDAIQKLHLESDVSPYAGIWYSVGLSAGKNESKQAAAVLRQVLSRIEQQQEYDRGRHQLTHASALNNLAICMIKAKSFDAAGGLLSQGLETMPIESQVIVHNARQLIGMANTKDNSVQLNSLSMRRLTEELSRIGKDRSDLTQGWYYSLDVDLPKKTLGAQPISGVTPPHRGAQPVFFSTGAAVTGSLCLTTASSLDLKQGDQSKSFGILTFHEGRVQSVGATLRKLDLDLDLAAFETEQKLLSPLLLRATTSRSSNDIAVFEFLLNRQSIQKSSVRSMLGVIAKDKQKSGTLKLSKPLFGPVVDRHAQFLGFASEERSETGNEQVVSLVPASSVNEFAAGYGDEDAIANDKRGFDQVRSACTLVIAWQAEQSTVPRFLNQDKAIVATALEVRDPWCIACNGTGFADCEACVKGIVNVKKPVLLGTNPFTGERIMGAKSFKENCGKCGAKGAFDCRHCKDGRL
ncbi:MAG: hypothetical protein WBD31_28580 [Rubripirellula sp.]